jgi:hypothetical protein
MSKGSKKFSDLFALPLFKLAAFLTCAALSQPVFAQEAIGKMESAADKVLKIFTGTLVRTILAISFCCSAVAYAANKDNDKVKRGALAVAIASIMIIAATGIVSFMMD